jgi:hypothetical protein
MRQRKRISTHLTTTVLTLFLASVPFWVNFHDGLQEMSDMVVSAAKPAYITGKTEIFDFVVGKGANAVNGKLHPHCW